MKPPLCTNERTDPWGPEFRRHHEALINERIAKNELKREAQWTEAIAVGSEALVHEVASLVKGRQQLEIEGTGQTWTLNKATVSFCYGSV